MTDRRCGNALLLTVLIILGVSGCSKPDSAEIRDQYISSMVDKINADSLKSYVTWMENMTTRFMLADNHRQVAVSIKKKFIRLGYADAKLDSFDIANTYNNIQYTTTQYNVIATLAGSVYSDSVCVIGAHYDDRVSASAGDPFVFAPGADDNASGVAATLEIARVMKKKSFVPSSTIRFVAFGAEEMGLYGSTDYAHKASVEGEKIRMMLNSDMIGIPSSADPSAWYVNIIDYPNSLYLSSEAHRLCERYTSLTYFNDNTSANRSDSYPFYQNGFKSLFFIHDAIGSTYHTPGDVATTLNYQYCREIAKISCAILVDQNYIE